MTAQTAQTAIYPRSGYWLLLSLGLFWGLNWPGMKIALSELPVWWFRSMSVGAGAFGLLAIAVLTGVRALPTRSEMRPLVVCTIFNVIGWNIFTGYGVSLMPAGRATIIAFTMPVWAALLSSLWLGERMTRYKFAGLLFGVLGLAALIGPDLFVFSAAPMGAVFMLAGAASWATGTVLFKGSAWTSSVVTIVGWQLLIGAVLITTSAAFLEPVPQLTKLSWQAIAALAYLFAIPMVYCHWAYFTVVRIFPAAVAALGTLLVPVVGVFSSALIIGEPIGWREVSALTLVMLALLVVLVLPALATGKRAAT